MDGSHAARAGTAAAIAVAMTMTMTMAGCDYLKPFEQLCEKRLPQAQISVEAAPVSYQSDYSRSTAELTTMGAASAGRMVLGLTQTRLNSSVKLGSSGLTQRFGGRHCMRPSVSVRLAFEPMTVYIGREFAQGSCRFVITMGHEMKHVRTYEVFLADVSEQVERELTRRLGDRIQYFASEAEAERHMNTLVNESLGPYVQDSMNAVGALQAQVDSPDEYFRLDRFQDTCGD
jgi:hypothetical protein